MTPTSPKLPEPATEGLKVVAWLYSHKVSGASAASDWRWPATHAARDFHVETHLVRLSDAQLLAAEVERLRAALSQIARWELPATGKFWDKEKTDPASYGAIYGSNGERDYMRALALAALDASRLALKDTP